MKKLLALLMSVTMLVSLVACGSNNDNTASSSEAVSSPATETSESNAGTEAVGETSYTNQLIVGSTTQITSDMMEGWTNGAQNLAIFTLLNHGMDTVQWTVEGEYVYNPVVLAEDIAATDNEDGSRTYTVKINEGLVYNDGSSLTAKDYVFEMMLYNSDEFAQQDGVDSTEGNRFVGWSEYNSGESDIFAGVNLLGDYEFAVTIAAENLPYHYETYDQLFRPLPMAVIAPDADIADDGEGCYMTGDWSADVLSTTILDPATGYRFNPTVTPGAYQFVSYDASTSEAVLELNPNFPGTWDGHQPSIEKLILRLTTSMTEMDELAAGTVDLLSGQAQGEIIEKGLDMVDEGTVDYLSFGRNGYGAIFFHCDFGPTQYEGVRRAIGWLLNRDDFALTFTGGYGVTMDTYAGYGQKEYQENQALLASTLTHYTLDPEKAIAELEEAGFTLDSNGKAYDASLGGADEGNIRHKLLDDGTLMPLTIQWCSSENNAVSDLLVSQLPGEASKVGMQITQTVVDFNTLLINYYVEIDESERVYNMYNLAEGFVTTQPYWYYFSQDPAYDTYNVVRIYDDELTALADNMSTIPYEDEEAWSEAWVALVTRWNKALPSLPLYSNLYHTFFNTKLENFTQTSTYDWYYGIVDANITGY